MALWCWILCGFSAGWKSPALMEVGQQWSCNDRVASCTVSENSFSLWRGWSCCWTPAPMFSRWWCSFGHIQEEFAFCTMLLAALPPSYDSLWLMRPTTVCRMKSKRLRKQSKSLLSGIGQELWLPAPTGIRKSRMQLWVQIFTSRKLIFTTIWFGQWSWEDPECLSTMICLVLAWLLALQW